MASEDSMKQRAVRAVVEGLLVSLPALIAAFIGLVVALVRRTTTKVVATIPKQSARRPSSRKRRR